MAFKHCHPVKVKKGKGGCLSSNFHELYTFPRRSLGLAHLHPLKHPLEHTAWLFLLAHRTDQSTVPSLPSLVPLFISLVCKGSRMTYAGLAQGPHYDRLSQDSNRSLVKHLIQLCHSGPHVVSKWYPKQLSASFSGLSANQNAWFQGKAISFYLEW